MSQQITLGSTVVISNGSKDIWPTEGTVAVVISVGTTDAIIRTQSDATNLTIPMDQIVPVQEYINHAMRAVEHHQEFERVRTTQLSGLNELLLQKEETLQNAYRHLADLQSRLDVRDSPHSETVLDSEVQQHNRLSELESRVEAPDTTLVSEISRLEGVIMGMTKVLEEQNIRITETENVISNMKDQLEDVSEEVRGFDITNDIHAAIQDTGIEQELNELKETVEDIAETLSAPLDIDLINLEQLNTCVRGNIREFLSLAVQQDAMNEH